MSANNAKQESETKIKSLTMSTPSFDPVAHLNHSESLRAAFIRDYLDGRSSAPTVTDVSQRVKTVLEEKAKKIRPSLLPVEVVEEGSAAMGFGTLKYEVDDWRTNPLVTERSLVDAIERHLIEYKKGITYAPDSKVTHLGHIIANCGILLARFGDKQ